MTNQYLEVAEAAARQDIERLRRQYAYATDLLGRHPDATAVAQGTAIYHQIFAPSATMTVAGRTTGGKAAPLAAQGPDGWAAVVLRSLDKYIATQHLLGTQLVTFRQLSLAAGSTNIQGGEAQLTSELQAWHTTKNQELRLVLGTYVDRVKFNGSAGWQITEMELLFNATEERPLGHTANRK